jgi:spore coat polysaccharide biosynthesis protein SpsF
MKQSSAHVTAIVQVRMNSSRLPGKSLADICGKPLLWHVLQRVRSSRLVTAVVIATTIDADDNDIARFAQSYAVPCYRGAVDDVLDRFYQASRMLPTDVIVRITADDPFKDPDIMDEIVSAFLDNGELDYVSNTLVPTFPEGLDIEVFSKAALDVTWREARLGSEREHVTPFIWKNPERFRLLNIRSSEDNSALRWTIDYPADLAFARAVYGRLYRGGVFRTEDIFDLLGREPDLVAINQGVVRNTGYVNSVSHDHSAG